MRADGPRHSGGHQSLPALNAAARTAPGHRGLWLSDRGLELPLFLLGAQPARLMVADSSI